MTAAAPLFDHFDLASSAPVPHRMLRDDSRMQRRSGHFGDPSAARLIKSVVDEAGLGKFVYLQGASGRRYVFSAIRLEQAALYDHALFAYSDTALDRDGDIHIRSSFADLPTGSSVLYVHLLDDDDDCGSQTMDDLCRRH